MLTLSCRKYKDKDLIGKWTSSIDSWCDTSGFNKVIIEFEENDIAYLNYSKNNGQYRWSVPYQCKWWIKKEIDNVHSINKKQWFLYVLRYDTLSYPCYVPCINCPNGSSYYGISFPDTSQYIITNFNDNSLSLQLIRQGFSNYEIFFSESNGLGSAFKTLNKQ